MTSHSDLLPLTALQREALRRLAGVGDRGAATAGWWEQHAALERLGYVRHEVNYARRPAHRWFITDAGRAALVKRGDANA